MAQAGSGIFEVMLSVSSHGAHCRGGMCSICLMSLAGSLSFLCPLFPKCVTLLPRAEWEAVRGTCWCIYSIDLQPYPAAGEGQIWLPGEEHGKGESKQL